jgi:hypothetical protein
MASAWGSHGSVDIDDGNGSSINIQITETSGVRADGLSLSTWGAAFLLSNILHKLDIPQPSRTSNHHPRGFEILELGAGTGLVGLSAAALWRRSVLLTDLPSILPALAANIQLNHPLLHGRFVAASCGSLDWTSPSSLQFYETGFTIKPQDPTQPSIILAADTFYDPDHPALVANAVRTWLATHSDSRAIFCYPLRFPYIDHIRDFWELMEAGGLECVQEGREMARDEWNEVPGTEFEWCVWRWKDGGGSG